MEEVQLMRVAEEEGEEGQGVEAMLMKLSMGKEEVEEEVWAAMKDEHLQMKLQLLLFCCQPESSTACLPALGRGQRSSWRRR